MLMIRHNVTFDYENEVISLNDYLIVVDPVPEYSGFITVFAILMVFFILLAVLFLYLVLCRKGAKRVKQLEDAANSTLMGPEEARVSLAVSVQRRESIAIRKQTVQQNKRSKAVQEDEEEETAGQRPLLEKRR